LAVSGKIEDVHLVANCITRLRLSDRQLFGVYRMTLFLNSWQIRFGFLAVLTASFVAWSGQAPAAGQAGGSDAASGVQQESVKIEPYKGKPIFLDEPEKVSIAPTIVNRETIQEKLGDGRVERQVAKFSDNSFAADGTYVEYYPNDKVFVKGQFVKGRQEGEWTYYFDNGQVNRKSTFKGGKPNGSWEVFRADGTLSAKRGFKDGLRDGEWFTYEETGKKPRTEEHYIAGEEDGVWKAWFPNGQQQRQVSFKNGKRDGTATEWNDKGQKLLEAEYVGGKFHGTATRWFADGRKTVLQYDNGKLVSESKQ
jgi:antitoxin component YwqK of YwqJK toxin-antitoxin module